MAPRGGFLLLSIHAVCIGEPREQFCLRCDLYGENC